MRSVAVMERTHMEQNAVSVSHRSVISGTKATLEYADSIQVDDVKMELKEESCDGRDSEDQLRDPQTILNQVPNLMPVSKEEPGEIQSSKTASDHRLRHFRYKINQSECYYIGSLLVQCPACDTSYRGGRHQLPRLFEHVQECHKKNCLRLIKSIKARYRVRKICDCFACLTQRRVNH